MASLLVNGTDTETLGLYVHEAILQGPSPHQITTIESLGRAGAILVPRYRTAARPLRIGGTLITSANTMAARITAEHRLRDRLRSGLITWTYNDGISAPRMVTGSVADLSILPRGRGAHPYNYVASDVLITVQCQEAYWQSTEPTIRSLAAASARYDLHTGTAPSSPVIRIMGSATNPVLTYRTAGGTTVWTLTFTVTLAVTTDYLELDTTTGRIWKYVSGVKTDGITLLTSGQQDWPGAIDSQDGDYATSAWPTIELSAGTGEVVYRKAWE